MRTRLGAAWRSLFRKRAFAREMDEEMGFHIAKETEKLVASGLSPGEARSRALRDFGGVARHQEEGFEAGGARWIETLFQDVKWALRGLRKNPAYAAAAAVTLALGIGANVAIFSVVHAVFLQALPYGGGDRLVRLRQDAPAVGVEDASFSALEVADYASQSQTLSGVVEYHSMSFILLGGNEPEQVRTGVVSASFFDMMGVRPLLGRAFVKGEDAPGAEPVLVLSYNYWVEHLGGDPKIVGRAFKMNDKIHTVVGVLPPIPQYPDENDLYMPISACPFRSSPQMATHRDHRMLTVFGRMKPGTTTAALNSDLQTIFGRLSRTYPDAYPSAQAGATVTGVPLSEELTRRARPTFLVLLAIVLLVLLLTCANVANLTLARNLRRSREFAMRSALGANRRRLLRQTLTETTVLGLLGGSLGVLLAAAALHLLIAFAARFTPRAGEIRIDMPVLLFALGVSTVTGLLFGAIPALSGGKNLLESLQAGSRSTSGPARHTLRQSLIVLQVAVSFMLLIGAGLMLRSLWKLQNVDPGFHTERVLTTRVALNFSKYTDGPKQRAFFEQLLERLQGQPAVVSASVSGILPLNPNGGPQNNSSRYEIEGHPAPSDDLRPQADFQLVSTKYLQTIGIPLLKGRGFATSDRPEGPLVALVNETIARHVWPADDPVGKRITLDRGKTWITIVGVVGDVREYGLERKPDDQVYVTLAQFPLPGGSLLVRTTSNPLALTRVVKDIVHGIDPDQPVDHFQTLDEIRTNALASPRLTSILLSIFAALALLITSAGIAGVIAFSVSERTQEFGVRLALGAEPGQVVALVLRQGLSLVAIGLALGFVGAHLLGGLMSQLLFEVHPTDPPTFLAMSVALAAVAATACFLPARRATSVDPMIALRNS